MNTSINRAGGYGFAQPKNVHPSGVKKYFGYFSLIIMVDLLLLPRLNIFASIPVSLPLVFYFVFKNKLSSREIYLLGFFSIILIVSVLLGTIGGDSESTQENIKRAVQLLTILCFTKVLFARHGAWVEIYEYALVVALAHIALSGLLFYLKPEVYRSIVLAVYPEASSMLDFNLYFGRFSHIFSDPNSGAYFSCFVVYALCATTRRFYIACLSLCILVIVVLLSQSRGGALGAVVVILSQLTNGRWSRREQLSIMAVFVSTLVAVFLFYSDIIVDGFEGFERRISLEDRLGGSRSVKYDYWFANFNLFPVGTGFTIVDGASLVRPHSDLIRINIAYGLPALGIVLYFMHKATIGQRGFLVLAMIPFLINSLIDDYRLMGLFFVLAGLVGVVRKSRRVRPRNSP